MARNTTPRKHQGSMLIAQGTCKDNTKVTGTLKKPDGSSVAGTSLNPRNKQSWAFKYTGLKPGVHLHTVKETTTFRDSISDQACYTLDIPAPPPPLTPPTVTAPANGDVVAIVFYPYGVTGAAQITQCLFEDQNGNQYDAIQAGTVQPPDADGNWSATIDTTQAVDGQGQLSPIAAGAPDCSLTVSDSNGSGSSIVNNITIASSRLIAAAERAQKRAMKKRAPAKKKTPPPKK